MKIKFLVIALILALGAACTAFFQAAPGKLPTPAPKKGPALLMFFSPGCHVCIKVKAEIIPEIEKKFKGTLAVEYLDINDIQNYKKLMALKQKYAPSLQDGIPVFYLGGRLLYAGDKNLQALEEFIRLALPAAMQGAEPVPEMDLVQRFKDFRLPMILGAGLIDGINPCAFTVIVFFISFLALQGYRKSELQIIGLTFIFAVFATYLLIGAGLFRLLFAMQGFALFVRLFNYGVGIFSIVLGNLALYDYFKFKRTKSSEGLLLQLPPAIKQQIHKVIGLAYRQKKDAQGLPLQGRPVAALAVSALVTGFLVSILEAVCTGQTYLPTIAFVLKTTPLKFQALGFLVLYNLMFILPLVVIFFLALAGTTSDKFSAVLQRHMLKIKFLMVILFFTLGIYLVWRG